MSKAPLYRGGDLRQYMKSCNADLRNNSIRPSPKTWILDHLGFNSPAPTIIPWTFGGFPAPWFAVDKKLFYIRSGAATAGYTAATAITDICPYTDGNGVATAFVCHGDDAACQRVDVTGTSVTGSVTQGWTAAGGDARWAACAAALKGDTTISTDGTPSHGHGYGSTTLTFAYTPDSGAAAKRLLVVGVEMLALSSSHTITGVTYDGVAMTKLATVKHGATNLTSELYYMKDADMPDAAAHNVVVTASIATTLAAGAHSYKGVNQTTPFGTASTATGTGSAMSVTAEAAVDNWVVAHFSCDYLTDLPALTVVSPAVSVYNNTGDNYLFCGSYSVATVPAAFATYAANAGGSLYANTDAGEWSAYKVGECLAGDEPTDGDKWGAGWPVGSPQYTITSIQTLGGAPVICKPEGFFTFSVPDNRYINRLEGIPIHTDNGKGSFVAGGILFYPTQDGSLWRFDGYNTPVDVGPKHSTALNRNAMHLRAPITAGCAMNEWVMVATAPWELGWTQELGLEVWTYNHTGTAYVDITTEVVDDNLATPVASQLAGLGVGDGDYLYIGSSSPIEAAKLVFSVANTASTAGFKSVQYYAGAVTGWVSVGTWADNRFDGTRVGTYGCATDGYVVAQPTTRYAGTDVMTKVSPGSTMGTKYWIRLAFSAAADIAAAILAEVYILPSRPPIRSGAFTFAGAGITVAGDELEYTGPDNAGKYPHILAGRLDDEGKWIWHDYAAINSASPITALSFTDADLAVAARNQGTSLIMLNRMSVFALLAGRGTGRAAPVSQKYASMGDGDLGTPIVYLAPTVLNGDDSDRATIGKDIMAYYVYGEYVNTSDLITVLGRWDHREWHEIGHANGAPVKIGDTGTGKGLVLETALALEDASVETEGPSISAIDVEFALETAYRPEVQPDIQTPEVE